MKTDSVLYWVIYFVVTILVAWIALSLILIWVRPVLFNADGSINWWNTLWVSALVILLAWLIIIILRWIIGLFNNNNCAKPCKKPCKDPCETPDPCDKNSHKKHHVKHEIVDPCDPCDVRR